MTDKPQRWWKQGVLVREILNGVEIVTNIGKTHAQLGITLNVAKVAVTFPKRTHPKPTQPIPNERWPIWARALKQFSKSEDKGIGDVVLRIIGNENSESFKAWHQKLFGRPCNCNGRLNRWNALYPLP